VLHCDVADITLSTSYFGRVELVSLTCNLILSNAIHSLVPWYKNKISSIKLEVHNVLQHHQRKKEQHA